jgi:preprotein translocase subunit SecY
MADTTAEALNNPDIRNRIAWLFYGFAIFALCVHIPIPGINRETWERLSSSDILQALGMFTGGALNKFSIIALGITPYINSSIIMQLMTVVIPSLKEEQKEGGEFGRKKMAKITRYLTIALAILQSTMLTLSLSRYKGPAGELIFLSNDSLYLATVVITLVSGTCFMLWLGETMTEKSLGNGVSLLIFAGIVMSYPSYMARTFEQASVGGPKQYLALAAFFTISLLIVISIIYMTLGVRKVPVQYPKRTVGNKVYGGQNTFLPIKVNNSGVMAIIFAVSILYAPSTLASFVPDDSAVPLLISFKGFVNTYLHPNNHLYNLLYAGAVLFFTFFYSALQFNVDDVADNLKKQGGFIPGIRPGRPTAEYLDRLITKLNTISGVYLAILAVAPTYVMKMTQITSFYLGSTSLLIIVGVALDTMQQIQARMVLRQYQGFMK